MKLERLFKGLADQNRLRIVNLLMRGELCVCDIQYVLGAAQPNVSRHLTYLKNAGLALDRRQGYRVYYKLASLNDESARLLFEFLQRAFAAGPVFRKDARRLRKAIEGGSCSVSRQQEIAVRTIAPARRGATSLQINHGHRA